MNDVVEVGKEHTAGIEVFDDIVENVTGLTLHELEKRGFHEWVVAPLRPKLSDVVIVISTFAIRLSSVAVVAWPI